MNAPRSTLADLVFVAIYDGRAEQLAHRYAQLGAIIPARKPQLVVRCCTRCRKPGHYATTCRERLTEAI